jgi:hypothetical protein
MREWDWKSVVVNSLHNALIAVESRIVDHVESPGSPTGQAEPGSLPRQEAVEFAKGETVR